MAFHNNNNNNHFQSQFPQNPMPGLPHQPVGQPFQPQFPHHQPPATFQPQHQPQASFQPMTHQPVASHHPQHHGSYIQPALSQKSQSDPQSQSSAMFDEEPPLLQELGIDLGFIIKKTRFFLDPLYRKQLSKMLTQSASNLNHLPPEDNFFSDNDLSGPLFYGVLLGVCLLLSGKVHFGYIYGIGVIGCLVLWGIFTLMSRSDPLNLDQMISILGYSLVPMVALAFLRIILPLNSLFGLILTTLTIAYCTWCAISILVPLLQLQNQQMLAAYPILLHFSCFALVTVF